MMRTPAWILFALCSTAALSGCPQDPGDPGGAVGPKGDRGDKGDKGDKGDTGAVGPKGDPGAAGTAGPKGDKGDTGPGGPAGAMGPAGPTGAIGPIGPAGPAGPSGPAGPAGSAGVPGTKGDPGTVGPKGDKGDPGPQGPSGPAGSGAYIEELGTFSGFTATTYTGSLMGGRTGAHALCSAAFAGSHLCHATEYVQSSSGTTPPTDGAWIDPSTNDGKGDQNTGMPGSGRYLYSSDCQDYTSTGSTMLGTIVSAAGSIQVGYCNTSRALACCNTPAKVRFVGLTRTAVDGNQGGRSKLHAACAAEFAGSHLCHATEWIRANSAASVPTDGAWIDPSTSDGKGDQNTGMPGSGRYLYSSDCQDYTSAGSTMLGTILSTAGSILVGYCNTARVVACCQ